MPNKKRTIGGDKDIQTPVAVYSATVVSVDTETYEMRVYGGIHSGISAPMEIPSTYYNVRDGSGAGIHFLPEVGSEVWVMETSDGTLVPISYHGAISQNYRNNRPRGIEGDIMLGTTDDNFIGVLRGGSIVMEAGALCKVLMDPFSDTFTTMASNIEEYTISHTREIICDESRECTSVLQYFKNAEDKTPVVKQTYGSGGSIYRFEGKNSDGINTSSLDVYQNGDIVSLLKSAHIKVENKVVVGPEENRTDFLINSTQFLSDLQSVLGDLQKLLIAVEAPMTAFAGTQGVLPGTAAYDAIVPSSASITAMSSRIASGEYPTTKLKSE